MTIIDASHIKPNVNWQPIETAPKDGSEVLVWGALYADGHIGAQVRFIAHWSDVMNAWKSEGRTILPTLWARMPPEPRTDQK